MSTEGPLVRPLRLCSCADFSVRGVAEPEFCALFLACVSPPFVLLRCAKDVLPSWRSSSCPPDHIRRSKHAGHGRRYTSLRAGTNSIVLKNPHTAPRLCIRPPLNCGAPRHHPDTLSPTFPHNKMSATAGSAKRWVPSKLRHIHEVPSPALNWRLLLAVLNIGLLGASRGMDEGVISGSIGTPAFEHAFNVKKKSTKESNIVAMVQLLSTLGALVGYATSDRFGRVVAGRLSCILIIVGCAMWMASSERIALLYIGRMVIGVGVGISSVCSPVFLVETVSAASLLSFEAGH